MIQRILLLILPLLIFNDFVFGQCSGVSVDLGNQSINFCSSINYTLNATISGNPTGQVTYAWTYQGNPISNQSSSSYLVPSNQPGQYGVTITYNGNCTATDNININLISAPTIAQSQCVSNGGTANLSVNFIPAIPSGVTASYSWTGPNGYTSNSPNPSISSFNASNAGTYNVSISLNPISGPPCTYTLATNLYLTPSAPTFSIPANGCLGTNYSPTGFTAQPNTTYTWNVSPSSNSTGLNGSSPVFNFNNSGSYSVSVTATQNGCSATSSNQGIAILYLGINSPDIAPTSSPNSFLAPPVLFSGAQTYKICGSNNASSVQISNYPPSANNSATQYTLIWGSNPGVNFSNGSTTTQSILIGNNPFTITATYGGCSTSINYNIYVGSNPYVSVGVGNSIGLCPGQNVVANITPVDQQGQQNSPGTTYDLYFSNNPNTIVQSFINLTTTTAAQPIVFNQSSCGTPPTNNCYPSQSNVYYAYVVATNACDNSCASSPAITVNEKPDANFTVSATTVCPNASITLTNTGTNGNTVTGSATQGYTCSTTTKIKYVITPNTGFTVSTGSLGGLSANFNNWDGTNTVVLNFTVPGTYTIKQYAQSNNCGPDSLIKTICVINSPTSSILAQTGTSYCSPASVQLSSNSMLPMCGTTAIPVSYSWTVTNPTNCPSCSNTISSPSSANSNFTFVNNSNAIQTFTVSLNVTPLDPITNQPLSNPSCAHSSSINIQVYPAVQITPLTTCNGTLNWNLNNQVNVPSTFTWQAAPNGNVSGESTVLQNTSMINDVLVNTSTTAQTVTYTVNATSVTGSCTATNTFTVNLVTPLTVQPLSNQTICVGGGLSNPSPLNLISSGGSGASTFSWVLNSGSSPVSTSVSYSPPIFNNPGTFVYTGTVTSGPTGCVQNVSQSATITVVADPTIITQPNNASYCLNANPVSPLNIVATGGSGTFSYQWYSNNSNSTTGGQLIQNATSASYTPPNSSTGTTFYYCIISQTGLNCSVTSNVAQVVVNPAPIVSSQPLSQTICVGGALSTLSVAYTGGNTGATYQWYSNTSASNTGGTILSGETNATFNLPSGLNNTAGIAYYYCVINFSSGSGCSVITSNVATISILADPTFSVQPIPSQTICEGGSINALSATVSGGSGTPSYQWYSVNGTTYTPITSNGTSATYTPPTYSSVGTYNYALLVTQSVSGCASSYSTNATVVVVADPTVTPPVGASYCQNASPVTPLTVTASNGNGSAYTYQWYSNSINSNSGGILQANSNSPTFTPPVSVTGTLYYYCLVTSGPSNSGCSTPSNTATITVTPGPSISSQPLSQTICVGGALSTLSVAYTGGNTGATYQWYSNTSASNTGGTILSGETNATFNLPSGLNNTAGIAYYYCVINFSSGSGCSVITSNVATISILADPTFSVQPIPSQTICEGGSINALSATVSGGSGTPSYQWYSVNGTTYTPITSNGTSATYTPPTYSSVGTYNYALLVTQSVSGCASSYSTNATVVVVADPTVTPPVGASYCQNASPVTPLTVTASNGNGSAYTYQWYSNSINSNSGGSLQANSNSPTFTPPVSVTGTLYYYCLVTSGPSNSGCSTPSNTATITVTPGPSISSQPLSQTICVGGALSTLSVAYTGGNTGATYQWYSNTSASNTGGTILSGETNATFNLPSGLNNTAGIAYYYCVINFSSGSGCSVITSNVATISILADPTFSVQPIPSQTICEGGSINALSATVSGGSGTPSYQWYSVNGTTYTPITSNGTSATYTPPTYSSVGTYNYALLVTQSVSGCASSYSTNATVVVVADPTVTPPVGASYCQNASPVTPLTVTASNGNGSAYTYQWYSNSINSNSGGILQANSNSPTFTPPVSVTGTLYYYCLVTSGPSNSGCSTPSATTTITVNSAPTFAIQPLATQTVCLDGTFSALTVTTQNGTGTPTFQWYSNTTSSTSGGTPIPGAITASYTPAATAVGTIYYYCIATFATGGCSNITSTIAAAIVVADPTISLQPLPSQTICVGGNIATPLSATTIGGIGTLSYQWSNATGAITGATNQNFTPPAFTTVGQYNYTVTITQSGSGCNPLTSQNALIEVVLDPIVSTQPIGASYCQNASPVAALSVTASGGTGTNYSYQWFNGTTQINGATSNTYNPSVASTGSIDYTCLVTIAPTTSGCSVTSAIATITVNTAPTFAIQPLATQTVCLDGTFSALTVTTQNGTGTPTFQWYSNTTSSTSGGTPIPGAITASYTPAATAVGTIYYYCIATFATGGCSNITSTIAAAIVVADPTISLQPLPSQTICVGGNIATPLSATTIGGIGTLSYQWSNATGAITGATNQNFTPPAFTTVGQYNYTVTITQSGSGCNPLTSQNALIEVVLDPIVSTQPIGASYCQNASPVAALSVTASGGTGTNYSYQWFNGTTQINGATSNTYNPSVASTGSIDYTCLVTIAPTTSGCSVTSAIATITVNAAPTFSTPPLTTQTVCLDGTFNALTVATQNGTGTPTFQWYSNTANSTTGGTSISGAINASFTPPANLVGTIYYYCIATFATGGCSNITSTIATAVVVADPVISAQPTATQSICVGGTIGSPITVTATGGTGTYSYQWSNATGAITGATNQNFTPPAFTTVGQYNYTVAITQSGSGCNAMISQNALIDVVADPVVSTQPINAEYCQNASPVAPLTVSATGGLGTFSYQWYSNTANNNTNGSLIPGATSSSFTPSVATVGTIHYYCVITQSGLNCGVTSNTAEIIVNLAPTFSTPPLTTQTVCLDGTFNALTVATQNGTGTPTFQWYSNTANSTTGGTSISGAINASFTPPANLVGTIYYYCIATFATGGCSNITSTIATAIVVADPVISAQPTATQSICVGGTIGSPITVTATGGTGTYSYQWSNATGAITGATNQNFTPPAFTTVGQYNYTVTITQSGSGCNAMISQNALIDVVADPVVSTQPINAEYCQNASPVAPLTVSATGGLGTFSYQWYSNTANNNTNGSLIPGATSSSFTPSVATVGTIHYYCVITQSGLNCGVTSNTAEIIVNLAPTFSTPPLTTQTVCLDGTFNALTVNTQNGTGTPTFQWYSNATSSSSGGTPISGATTASYTPPGNAIGTVYYYCVATYATGGCSAITSTIATAIVVADPIISLQPIPAQSICVGGNIANALTVSATGGTGAYSYQWSNASGAITGATNQNFPPPAFTTVGQYNYTVTITQSGSGCNAMISQNALIDVVADPVVSTQPISASYCQNGSPVSPLAVTATGGLGTFSYQWYSNTSNNNSGGALILGATSSSYTPSVTTVGTIYYYCVITQSGLNCGVTSNTAAITVSLAPTFVLQPISQTICTGGTFAPLSVSYQDGTGVPSYQWFSNSTNNYSGAVAISGETSSTFQPSAANLGTTYYFCEISFSFGGCSSINSNISNQTVVADPVISVQPQATQSICVGGSIPTALNVIVTGGTGAVTYQWFSGTNQVSGAIQDTYLPSIYTIPGTFNYTANISISGVGCNALISQPAQVIVVDDPSVSQPLAAVYCQNATPITPLQVNVTGGLGTNLYQWYFSTANTTSGGTAIVGANSSSYVPSVATVGTAYYYCIVNQSGPNCATTSVNASIQVNLPPTISLQPIASQTLCEGGAPTLLQVAYINGTNSATYQWYSNNSNSNIGGTPISNATTASYNPQSTILGTTYYYCVITFQQGGCSSLTTIAAQVTIVGDPAITTQPLSNQEICQGNTINNALTFNYTGGTGNATIAWYLDATPPVLINGVTTNSYLPIPFNIADTFSYFATLSYSGVGCDTDSTQLAEIIVHPTPYATNLNDTIVACNHSNLNIPLTATVTSTFSWQTQLTTAVNGESFLPQTSYSIDDSLSNTTTNPQFLTYTVTPTSFPYGCVGPDSTVVVQLQPDVILSMNQAMEICSGSPVNGILTSNIPSTFNWFVSIDNPNVTGESILPSTNWLINDVLVNSSTVNQVVIYSVFPVSIQGQCPGLAQPLVVTVKPPIDLLNPDTLTICSGQNVGINLVANTNVNFNWYASPSLNVTGETTSVVSSPLINDVLVNPTNAIEVVTYNVIGTSTANGCSSPVIPLYVVVNPIPSLVNLNPLTICNGNYLYPYSLQTSVVGATTNWSVLNNPIGIPSTFGSNTLPGFIATNNTIITQTGQILITPIYTNNNVTCIGNDTTLLIPVLPTPSVNPIADITACNLTQIPLTPVNGPVPNTVFEWYNANVSLGLNASGIGDIPTFVGLNNTTIPVSGTVTVAPSYTQNNITCQGNPIDFEITVNPSPTLLNSNIEICDGEFTNILLNANIPSTFQWNATIQANVYNETAAPVQNTAYINDQLVLATTTAQTVTYNVTPISAPYACIGFDTTILVQVNPLPIVDFSVITPILCDQSQINFQNNSVGSLDFTWTFGDGDSSFLFNPVHEYANFGSYLVTLEAVDQLTGCFNDAAQTLIINESPEADFTISDTLACGSLDVTFNALDLNPNWSYLWIFGDGTSSNQYGLAGHQYITNGCFDINLQISTPEGCVTDATQFDGVCIYPEPIAAFTMDDPVVSSLTPEVQFFNSSLFADSYFWEFGDGTTSQTENTSHLFPPDPATYVIILTASNNVGCQDTAALSVTVWQDLAIYVPNTFTPNDDEYNQTFKPVLTDGFKKDSYHMTIFNRWGQIVFESKDLEYGWDGSYKFNESLPVKNGFIIKDIICQDGTYTWKIEVTELQSGEVRKFIGHVNLIR